MMNAPVCDVCGCVHAPSVMLWTGVDYAPDTGVSMGPVCPACHAGCGSCRAAREWRTGGECLTMTQADAPGLRPTEADLRDWIDEQGASEELFLDECVHELTPVHVDVVPYGSTQVELPARIALDDVPAHVQLEVAHTWWVDGRIDWVLDEEVAEPWRVFLRDTVDGLGQVHMRDPQGWKPGKGDVLVATFATRQDVEDNMALLANPSAGTYVGNLMRDGVPVVEAVRRVYRIEKADRTMSLRLVGTTTPRSK